MELGKQTVEIVDRRTYASPNGSTINLTQSVDDCLASTRYFSAEDLYRLQLDLLASPSVAFPTIFEVVNETTLAGISRLQEFGPVAALNFASAKNPGGGFLNGSQAQEESLARSSALYASLQRAWIFYKLHRESPSLLYSDAMILSPACPIIRDDDGTLLDVPQLATLITSAAPNAGAAADNRPQELKLIPEVFQRRAEYVLALAASQGHKNLVLGAWGCGVFRNDPHLVAKTFANHLCRGRWAGRFERVVFSVLDNSEALETFTAFQSAFAT
jgi:uncharacterized protein (TIGR02452 family)